MNNCSNRATANRSVIPGQKIARRRVHAVPLHGAGVQELQPAARGSSPRVLPGCRPPCGTPPWTGRSRRPTRKRKARSSSVAASVSSLIRISSSPAALVVSTTSLTMRPIRTDGDPPSTRHGVPRQVRLHQQPRSDRIVGVVVHVGDEVGHPDQLALERGGLVLASDWRTRLALRVAGDAVAHLPGEVQAAAVPLQRVDHSKALRRVGEPARHERVERALAPVPERRVPEVVAEADGFGQVFVQVAAPWRSVRAICETSSVCVSRVR